MTDDIEIDIIELPKIHNGNTENEEGLLEWLYFLENPESEGMEKGIEKGMAKGMEKGREEGKLELIIEMLKNGVDEDFIVKISGVTKEKILQIKKNMSKIEEEIKFDK